MAALYEEARRPRGKLPEYLQQPGAVPGSFVRYERHGVYYCDGIPTMFFLYSLDGEMDEDYWYMAELQLDTTVYERAEQVLGEDGLEQAKLSIGICAACWLLMDQPRTSLRVAAAAGRLSAAQLKFWTQTLRGTLAEFQYLNRLPYHPIVVADDEIKDTRPSQTEPEPSPEPEPEPEPEETQQAKTPASDGAVIAAKTVTEARMARVNELEVLDKSRLAQQTSQIPSRPDDGVLVPLGGGKDCLTLLELLRDAGVDMAYDCVLFHLSDRHGEWSENWRLAALHRASGVRRCVRAQFIPPRLTKTSDLFGAAFAVSACSGTCCCDTYLPPTGVHGA